MSKTVEDLTEEVDVEEVELQAETLRGDVRAAICDHFRAQSKPWEQMPEAEQHKFNSGVEKIADNLVREVVRIVASEGRMVIGATLENVTVKDEIKAVMTMLKSDEGRHAIVDSVGSRVQIVVANAGKFMGQKEDARVDKDQPELAMGNVNEDDNDGQTEAA